MSGLKEFLLITLLGVFLTIQLACGSCGPSLEDGLEIVQTICAPGNHEDDVAKRFFECNEIAPGGHLVTKCQVVAFGVTMSTKENVEKVCAGSGQLVNYDICLRTEYAAAGLNQRE